MTRATPSSLRSRCERQAARWPDVIDTDVFSADLVPGSALWARYEPIVVGRPAFISFQTVAELRFGALRRGWGEARLRRLDARIARAEVVYRVRTSSAFAHSFASTARGSVMR